MPEKSQGRSLIIVFIRLQLTKAMGDGNTALEGIPLQASLVNPSPLEKMGNEH